MILVAHRKETGYNIMKYKDEGGRLCRLFTMEAEWLWNNPSRIQKFHKDFYWGFYCTSYEQQALRWATRFGKAGVVNVYSFDDQTELKIKRFPEMSDERLDFIAACRNGVPHDYDVVEGPMADDTIFNYVQSFLDGEISRAAFWELAKFKYPTHQISFHTARALAALKFERSYVANVQEKQ